MYKINAELLKESLRNLQVYAHVLEALDKDVKTSSKIIKSNIKKLESYGA